MDQIVDTTKMVNALTDYFGVTETMTATNHPIVGQDGLAGLGAFFIFVFVFFVAWDVATFTAQ